MANNETLEKCNQLRKTHKSDYCLAQKELQCKEWQMTQRVGDGRRIGKWNNEVASINPCFVFSCSKWPDSLINPCFAFFYQSIMVSLHVVFRYFEIVFFIYFTGMQWKEWQMTRLVGIESTQSINPCFAKQAFGALPSQVEVNPIL